MDEYRYKLVDVFTREQFQGNQLAVFPMALGLTDESMQQIARELNLAETTFVFPPSIRDCIARVRIFTPLKEMPFAGHPTIGTASVLIDEGLIPPLTTDFYLQENIGPVRVRVAREDEGDILWLRTPEIQWGRVYDRSLCATVLGLELPELLTPDIAPQRLSAGNPTVFVPLRDPQSVDRAWLSPEGMQRLRGAEKEPFCVFIFALTSNGVYARMFAPEYGVPEDPATGSATGPLAAYMIKNKLFPGASGGRFVSEQGTKMKRRSILHVQILGNGADISIEVGGYVARVGEGKIRFS